MGANGGWTRLHNLFGDFLKGSLKPVAAEITQDDSGVVHYHTVLLTRRLFSVLYAPQAVGRRVFTSADAAHTAVVEKKAGRGTRGVSQIEMKGLRVRGKWSLPRRAWPRCPTGHEEF
jgi:hypothetical protein